MVYWFTGLSGAGKTTLASKLHQHFVHANQPCVHLDGDALRAGVNKDLGFETSDRNENIRRTAEIAKLLFNQSINVIVSLITPLEAQRSLAKFIVGEPLRVIHLHADLQTCEARDPKGLYAKARQGLLPGFTGLDAPFEVPQLPDLILDTQQESIEKTWNKLIDWINTA